MKRLNALPAYIKRSEFDPSVKATHALHSTQLSAAVH
jgi:hypothetical protein